MFRLGFIPVLLLVVLSALGVVAQTQQPIAKPDKIAAPTTGAIKGRVVSESGQPLSNAIVSAGVAGANPNQSVVTSRDGTFQLNDLETGSSYYLSAQMPSYTAPRPEPGTQPRTYRVGESVTLTLVKGAVITGTVTSAAGEPIVGIRVRVERVMRDRNGKRLPSGGVMGERQTDDRGVYRIYGLPPGTYVVMAGGSTPYYISTADPYETDAPTYANSATRDTATEITLRSGEEAGGFDIRYRAEQGRTISGLVTGAGRGFNVMLSTAGDVAVPWNASTYQQLDDTSFSFIGVVEGDYDLYAYARTDTREYAVSEVKRIRLSGGDATGIELATRPLASVAGRVVVEETKPPECTDKTNASFGDMNVGAWHNDTDAAKETPQALWSLGTPVKPGADGNFVLLNLIGGEYYFVVRAPAKNLYVRSIEFQPEGTGKKPVDVSRIWTSVKTGERLSGLTFTLAQGAASLSGQFTLGEGEKVPARTFVYLAPVERERAGNPLNYLGSPVDTKGKFGWPNIPPGRYWIYTETLTEENVAQRLRLRYPQETETRAQIRRAAEAGKNEILFKPCQQVVDYKLPLKPGETP